MSSDRLLPRNTRDNLCDVISEGLGGGGGGGEGRGGGLHASHRSLRCLRMNDFR